MVFIIVVVYLEPARNSKRKKRMRKRKRVEKKEKEKRKRKGVEKIESRKDRE